jgi:uncharacterized membrane protein
MVDLVQQVLEGLGAAPTVLIMSMFPIVELRGAIPVGIALGLSPLHSTILGFLGSMVPVPFILFGIRPIFSYLRQTKLFKGLVDKLTNRSLNNHGHKIQKYGTLGLIILVAIPLPGTGVWSGSLIAALLDVRFKWAFPAILIGNFIAAILIVLLSNGVVAVLTS